ncbi:hypothetical protein I553_6573 [Mycobacterium xenopi 4042]|uniref:Uncharacterized protein n=1 Tax=Mycobacterium xenopi 4042 TaxID=1299334 RepID=X8BHK1_MYCXE|nr:hypothetical protein I552_6223 [Mycobacterium xenopi 3993]EUA42713.1 hypothetical protein I553_6573 [Mycobacterium xenopi 4042]
MSCTETRRHRRQQFIPGQLLFIRSWAMACLSVASPTQYG